MKYKIILLSFLLILPSTLPAQKDSVTIRDISYVSSSETDAYRKERCKLDIYKPGPAGDYPTIVFFTEVHWKWEINIFPKNLKAVTLS